MDLGVKHPPPTPGAAGYTWQSDHKESVQWSSVYGAFSLILLWSFGFPDRWAYNSDSVGSRQVILMLGSLTLCCAKGVSAVTIPQTLWAYMPLGLQPLYTRRSTSQPAGCPLVSSYGLSSFMSISQMGQKLIFVPLCVNFSLNQDNDEGQLTNIPLSPITLSKTQCRPPTEEQLWTEGKNIFDWCRKQFASSLRY